jgi:hypothetical protein
MEPGLLMLSPPPTYAPTPISQHLNVRHLHPTHNSGAPSPQGPKTPTLQRQIPKNTATTHLHTFSQQTLEPEAELFPHPT